MLEFALSIILIICAGFVLSVLFTCVDFAYAGVSDLPSSASLRLIHKFLYHRFSVIVREERVNDQIKYRVYVKCWVFPSHYVYGTTYEKYNMAKNAADECLQSQRKKYDERFLKKTKNVYTINSI